MRKNSMYFYKFKAPFRVPIRTPLIELKEREVLIVEWQDMSGTSYYGECNAFSTDWYHSETIDKVEETLLKWFKNHELDDFNSYPLSCKLIDELKAFPNARSVMSMIFYQKFHKLEPIEIVYGATINQNIAQYFKQYKGELPTRIKLKWHEDIDKDITYLTENYPQIQRVIDANGVIKQEDIALLNTFKDKQFIYIEQPFSKYNDYMAYVNALELPIFIDESAINLEQIIQFHEQQLIEGVVIKPSRVGGIDKALEIIEYCREQHLKYVIGGMYEFGLSSYFTAYLAQQSSYPSDVTPSDYYFIEDFVVTHAETYGHMIKYLPPIVDKDKL